MYISKRLLLSKPLSIIIFPIVQKIKDYTLLTYEPLFQNYQFLKKLDKEKIDGSVVECGSWKGGNGAFMAKVSGRETWLFDSFEGMPERKSMDNKTKGKRPLEKGDLAVSEDFSREIIKKLGVEKNTKVIKGWFSDSLPKYKNKIGPIALLRIDGDFYSSTKTVLEELYDQVVPRGYIIFDDLNDFEGCQKAVNEFFKNRNIKKNIEEYDPMGKPYIRKSS